ncbi:MAG: hypothetical protein HY507_01025 [Candidatus Zambryskibacteria bacterium]|nr:hypothetical protein [Candidatus Zambryskibacteria bacterium]
MSQVQPVQEEVSFAHPVSKRVVTGVRMVPGMTFKPEAVYLGTKDWMKCPPQLADGTTKLRSRDTLWIIPINQKQKKS